MESDWEVEIENKNPVHAHARFEAAAKKSQRWLVNVLNLGDDNYYWHVTISFIDCINLYDINIP